MVNSKPLKTPLSEGDVRDLRVGDMVSLSGYIVTGRDRVHKFLFNERPPKSEIPFNLDGSILYHCGPIIRKTEDGYKLIAGGPTTSMRVEMYEHWVIKEYGIRAVMGKGGMGSKTMDALRECGCVYLHTIGGAAVYLADRVKKIVDGWKVEEFGMAEAMWLFDVEGFPAVVTMDAHGNSLHREVEALSADNLRRLLKL